MTTPVQLQHRSVIEISGADAESFLQGLITQSPSKMDFTSPRYGALLTPQGKVVADFLFWRTESGYLIDCANVVRDELIKRLSMYKLRSDVRIAAREDLSCVAFIGSPDPRATEAPHRCLLPTSDTPAIDDLKDYAEARVSAGLSEQGIDFDSGEIFPADINMDLLHGIDFQKGCFVGQEVVSRMKRRGTARRRTVRLELGAPSGRLPCTVTDASDELGIATSGARNLVLGRVRIDRLAEAKAAGREIRVGEVIVCSIRYPNGLEPADIS